MEKQWWGLMSLAPLDGTLVEIQISCGRLKRNVVARWGDFEGEDGWVDRSGHFVRGEDEEVTGWQALGHRFYPQYGPRSPDLQWIRGDAGTADPQRFWSLTARINKLARSA